MGYGLLVMGDGLWAIGNGRLVIGDGRLAMGDGQWAIGDGRWEMDGTEEETVIVNIMYIEGKNRAFRCEMPCFIAR